MSKTNPTQAFTSREFAAIEQPLYLNGLSDRQLSEILDDVERRGFELARRLGVDSHSDRLPAYIWSIIFAQRGGAVERL